MIQFRHFKNVRPFVLMIIFASSLTFANGQNTDERAIRRLLEKQRAGWNHGKLEEFMRGYWESDSLLFIGKNGPNYGYKTTLDNYKKSYADTTAMGKLHFELLQLQRLSNIYYHVTGKWTLVRSVENLQGYFTLLFKKIKNKWVIILDHSS